jgi:peptide/nickel transport system permease protein
MKGHAIRRPALAAAVTLGALCAAAVLVPWLSSDDPAVIGDVLSRRLVGPLGRDANGGFHLLGTDRFGRDMFTRIMTAARISIAVGIIGSLLATAAGTALGAVAAWSGGLVDRVLMALADLLLSLPRIVLLLVCAALWGPGVTMMILVLVFTGWMSVARLVRAELLGVRVRPFVDAAFALGGSAQRVLWTHALPNAIGPAIVAMTLGVGNTILLESALSFLGLGIQPPEPSWGNMIAGGRDLIVTAPWVALTPGIMLIITVMCCTLLGDELRDRIAGSSNPAEYR